MFDNSLPIDLNLTLELVDCVVLLGVFFDTVTCPFHNPYHRLVDGVQISTLFF